MSKNVDEIVKAILAADETGLQKIHDAVYCRRDQLDDAKRLSFSVGDRVKFISRRTGGVVKGVVDRKGPKNIMVRPDGGGPGWRVAPGYLQHDNGS